MAETDTKTPVVVPLANQLSGMAIARQKMDLARKKTRVSNLARGDKQRRLIEQLDEMRRDNEKCDLKLMIAAANYVLYGIIPGQKRKERMPSAARLAMVCGISQGTLWRWCNEPTNDWHLRFKMLVERLKANQEVACLNAYKGNKGTTPKDSPEISLAKLVLESHHGYHETKKEESDIGSVLAQMAKDAVGRARAKFVESTVTSEAVPALPARQGA